MKEYGVGKGVGMDNVGFCRLNNEVLIKKEDGKMKDYVKKDVLGMEYYEVKVEDLGLDKLEELLKDKKNVWDKGVRDWSWSIGKVVKLGREEWLKRMFLCVSMMFNFWEDKEYGVLKSEDVWNWGKCGCDKERFLKEDKWNLRWERYEIVWDVERFLRKYNGKLEEVCGKEVGFWKELNVIWNGGVGDVVGKKVVLCKMILEDMGFKVVESEGWGVGCIDYNVMVMLSVLGIKEIEGRYWDKEELDDIRRWVNGWCVGVCKVKGIDGSVLDGVLFNVGRMLRGKMGSNDLVAKVVGEVNY